MLSLHLYLVKDSECTSGSLGRTFDSMLIDGTTGWAGFWEIFFFVAFTFDASFKVYKVY